MNKSSTIKTIIPKAILALLLALSGELSYSTNTPQSGGGANPKRVTGIVIDSNSEPIVGATIIEKGTSKNVVLTDVNGKFTITVSTGKTIIVRYMGYTTKEVEVTNETNITIVLQDAAQAIDEVVVVGYGSMRKKDVTGAIARATFNGPETLTNNSITQALQGSIAGLNVGMTTGAGSESGFTIRGTNTLNGGTKPLVVVDGIIYEGSLNDISPTDVLSVEVLKDASSAAIYGSRAANGVVLITTKMGKSEKPQINFNGFVGVNFASNKPKMMNGEKYIQKILDYRRADKKEADPAKITDYLNAAEVENYMANRTVDTYDQVVSPGLTQTYDISFSGKSKYVNYYSSINYGKENGVVENDNYSRVGVRLNLESNITEWLKIGIKTNFSKRDYSGLAVNLLGAMYMSPYAQLYNEDGTLVVYPMTDQIAPNPFLESREKQDRDLRSTLLGVGYAEINFPFLQGLKYNLNFSNNYRWTDQAEFWGIETQTGMKSKGKATQTRGEAISQLVDNIVSYADNFGKHYVNATLLYSYESNEGKSLYATATDFSNSILGWDKLQSGKNQTASTSAYQDHAISQMSRLHYGYDNKYMATFTIRRDGYSGFGAGKKFGIFPSIALAYNITNEPFMKNIDKVSSLKLRFSYGRNGSQAVGRYRSLARVDFGQYVVGGESVVTMLTTSMANNQLGWESTIARNIGVDMGFFNDKLMTTIDIYSSDSEGLLMPRTLPIMNGYSSVWANIGQIQNKGIELTINSKNYELSKFQWNTNFVFSLYRNKISHLYGTDTNNDGKEDDDTQNQWFIGEPLGVIYGYQASGIYQTDDEISELLKKQGYKPGYFKIVDNDGKEGVSPDDRSVYGYTAPNFRFSIFNELKYGDFRLSVMINSVMGGGKYYKADNSYALNPNAYFPNRQNMPDIEYWTPERHTNDYPIINYSAPYGHAFLQDRSFVRLQDMTFSYNMPTDIASKIGMNSIRAYVSGKNLYTWTKWTGYDPETGQSIFGGTPSMRTFVLGLNITL